MKNKNDSTILVISCLVIGFFAGIAVVNNYVAISGELPNDGVFSMKAESWGTISDWLMLAVTFVTALFLVKTFREQKKMNDLQIENYRELILPRFSIWPNVYVKQETNGKLYYYIKLEIHDNPVKLFLIRKYSINFLVDYLPIWNIAKDTHIEIRCTTLKLPTSNAIMTHVFTFEFTDIKGNKYYQQVYQRDNKLQIELPELQPSKA